MTQNRTPKRAPPLRLLRRLAACAAAAALVAGTPALAAPSSGLEGKGTRLSDAEMSEMRGKFFTPNQIQHFGIQMVTSWQGADGVTTEAILLFSVGFADGATNLSGATPQLMIAFNRLCDGCGDSAMDVAGFGPDAEQGYVAIGAGGISIGALDTVNGAVQSQQIAGADNRVVNQMRIAVMPISAVRNGDVEGLTAISQGMTQSFADGDTIRFILEPGEIGMALAGGTGAESIHQTIRPAQLAQHVLLNSDRNMVHNNVTVTVGLNDLVQSSQINLQNALSTMKGHGF